MHIAGVLHGYVCVSTDVQNIASQLDQLKSAECERIYREKVSGATADRPQLKRFMAALSPGDAVVVPAVDRLSRDTIDLLVIARDMQLTGAGLHEHARPDWGRDA